jgi:hypothetical protein
MRTHGRNAATANRTAHAAAVAEPTQRRAPATTCSRAATSATDRGGWWVASRTRERSRSFDAPRRGAPRDGARPVPLRLTRSDIDADELKKLFVPFHSSFAKGTGLGLPIVYQIVNAHNGTISVKSRRGVGSVFAIDI